VRTNADPESGARLQKWGDFLYKGRYGKSTATAKKWGVNCPKDCPAQKYGGFPPRADHAAIPP